jgi:hypothetical protein
VVGGMRIEAMLNQHCLAIGDKTGCSSLHRRQEGEGRLGNCSIQELQGAEPMHILPQIWPTKSCMRRRIHSSCYTRSPKVTRTCSKQTFQGVLHEIEIVERIKKGGLSRSALAPAKRAMRFGMMMAWKLKRIFCRRSSTSVGGSYRA